MGDFRLITKNGAFYPDENPPTWERSELTTSAKYDPMETFTNVSDSRWYKPKTDPVKTPSHYIDGRKYEPRKVIQDWGLCWELGNALKYIARAGRKDNEAEDLRKAIEYLNYRLEAIDNG